MKEILDEAIRMLLDRDLHLFQADANERTIMCCLACHLKTLIHGYDVDCEYNRNQKVTKVLQSHGFTGEPVAPDIIVHRRGTDDNQLVVEAKKASRSQAVKDKDRRKLRAFVEYLGYRHAAFLIIRTGAKNPGIDQPEWIER